MPAIRVVKTFGYGVVRMTREKTVKYGNWEEKFAWLPVTIIQGGTNHYGGEYSGETVWLKKYYERRVIDIVTFSGGGELWADESVTTRVQRSKHLFDLLKS